MVIGPSGQEPSDEVLCALTAAGDRLAEETLIRRYSRLVRVCARPFFLAGGDSEDLIQEGMLGLLKAIREFDPSRDASFRTFSVICIRRCILSAIAAASCNKHGPLNESVPFETPFFDFSSEWTGGPREQGNPEDLLIDREESRERIDWLKGQLSPLECDILDRFLKGYSYQEIACSVGRSIKSVNNAVQRIRHKVVRRSSPGVCSES